MEYKSWKIRLEAESPFLIGTHRVMNNHFETLEYIPAKVLQAAFARVILESHADYELQIHGKERNYYIEENHEQITATGCLDEFKEWFKAFNHIYFSDATPMGSQRYTPTTYICKSYGEEHPLVESLPFRYTSRNEFGKDASKFECKECEGEGEGRLERKDGWMMKGSKMYKRLITRVGIDQKRLVSKDEQLYSLSIGEPYSNIDKVNQETEPLYFEATLFTPKEINGLESINGQTIYVGANITSGLGKMKVSVVSNDNSESNQGQEEIRQWQKQVGDCSIPIQLLSDVCFNNQYRKDQKYQTNEELLQMYTTWLQTDAKLPEGCHVEFFYMQSYQKRGFQQGSNQLREDQMRNYIQNGAVCIFNGDPTVLNVWINQIVTTGLFLENEEERQRIPVKIVSVQIDEGGQLK